MARLKEFYKAEVAPALMKKFEYKSVMQIPKFDKIVVNVGCGDAKENGKVIAVSPEENKVIVENINKATKHVKARRQGEQSSIVKVDAPMYACKVALYCPKCDKGVRTHIEVVDGKKVRVCAKCGYKFD